MRVILLFFCGLIASCGNQPPQETQTEAVEAQQSETYVIGPGDTLQVNVWNNKEVSAAVSVRPDGRITTPLVEDMQAVGKTPNELARDIEAVLSEYIRSPKVSVIVSGFVGNYSDQVRVIGQAAEPKVVPYRDGMTLLDVMIEVGGLGETAAGNRAKIVRRQGNQEIEIRVKLDNLINKGRIGENMAIRPGDILIIPQSRF